MCVNYAVPIPVEELPQCIGSEELSLYKLALLVVINIISVPSPNQVKIPMTNWLFIS